MDYRKAYEELNKAIWQFDKAHNDAYVRLMLAVREIDGRADECTPSIALVVKPQKREE